MKHSFAPLKSQHFNVVDVFKFSKNSVFATFSKIIIEFAKLMKMCRKFKEFVKISLPAEPAFRVATTTTTATATTATTLADLDWGFSRPAAVRPGRRWIGGFPGRRRSGRDGVGLGIFRDFPGF